MNGDLPETVVREIVARALAEDIGPGDITTLATIRPDAECRAEIVARAAGVIAGLGLARAVFHAVDAEISFDPAVRDGALVSDGLPIARLSGPTRAILTAERTALNFLQRMSGIATLTAQYVHAVEGTDTRIIDTRKTAPGLRLLDKYAVRMGGGRNHRVGLFDGVLIKDNHLRAAGGVGEAVRRARASAHHLVKIEVEVQALEEVEEAVSAGADVILLDNMDLDDVRRSVALVSGRGEIEVSGGVTLENVRALAECGVSCISIGSLTHSAPALDLSLEIVDD
ncbi:MAG TPA: carboxylating nicotinate-nucleotide diphosphorylase [Armatimonadota bacterium]|nr:carboxylating nicotinate-nucleotide diphosphorylase [Armatimonadota bacterium]